MVVFPPLAPVPSPAVRRTIPSKDWEACLDAWMALLGFRLNSNDAQFAEAAAEDPAVVPFLESFYQQTAAGDSGLQSGPKARKLRKLCFLTARRYMLLKDPLPGILQWSLLGDLCCCYPSSAALRALLSETWDLHHEKISLSIEKAKSQLIGQLATSGGNSDSDLIFNIRRLTILASTLPPCGQVLMAGSDYLDTLAEAYQSPKDREELRKNLVANVYVGLVSLLKGPANLSLLLDQLFSLKSAAGLGTPQMKHEATMLSDLVCSSDILARLEKYLASHPQKRAENLLASLHAYQMDSKDLHRRYQRRKKADKGKGPSSGLEIPEEIHAHKLSLISQVQDLFPDLGSAFVVRLLDVYGDNPETVVAHLLDDSLAPELQAPRPTPPDLTPPLEPVPVRRNVFDTDVDLAELSLSDNAKGKIRFGRANPELTADEVLADRSQHSTNKAAILSALAAFDSDDDERDDTYDEADVGGTVDSVAAGTDADGDAEARNRAAASEAAEMSLFRTYKSNAALFGRDSATRRSQPRAQLKRETNMTDEAIEGWAVMLARDPKRLARLDKKLADDLGGVSGGLNQPDLEATSYRKPRAGEEGSEDESAPSGRGPGQRGRGRGWGHGRGRGAGRGGSHPQTGEQSNTAANRRKEENKASRANHNRRQQRAKKIARGGGLPG
ncbi:hypothetical protein N7468_009626 [Penicillium chermesinum]|uniref:CUE domain-containing protein n=1 Tax=Penicillium chermesinum TaxID=63820 RepID=A0A9W9NI71_9EURO|nr:uncharacterized protein N7468_009626 [Penicillium chermesinum]KAJ5220422.1 hypothetical protein N7468_009626 [Penicillium chermesinum]KAJ6157861.1 hypothetical protein N7470_005453 [Penicillium chermesinum]